MAGKEVLSLCKFSESQVQKFQKLEKQMKEKWNLGLRYDSKVPSKDKWFLYFFTLKSVDRKKICQVLKDFEKKFQDINTEIKKLRGGENIDPEHVQRTRELFEKVIEDMKYVNRTTDSSTVYKATRHILSEKDDTLRLFDKVEVVQSRQELHHKENQLRDLEEEVKNQDNVIYTLQRLLGNYLEKDTKQAMKIREFNDQIKDNKKFLESSGIITKLMRKLKYMRFDRCDSEPYEYGSEIQKLAHINISVIHNLNEFSVFFEGFRLRENKRDSKLENLEEVLRINSEILVSKDLNDMKDLISNFFSVRKGSYPNETSIMKGTREGENSEPPSTTFSNLMPYSNVLKSGDDTSDFLEKQLISSYAQCNEIRHECEELMKLMAQMVLNTIDCRAKVNGIVIDTFSAEQLYEK